MSKGEYVTALNYFERAKIYTPAYPLLEVNLGIVNGALGREGEAENHFRRALALDPEEAQSYYYYGNWLNSRGRTEESIANLEAALRSAPNNVDARDLLMQIYFEQGKWSEVQRVAEDTLRLAPNEVSARHFLDLLQTREQALAGAEKQMRDAPTADGLINLSLLYYQEARYSDCIRIAQRALQLKPDSAEAYNNIAAAYNSMGRWDDGIQAATEATRLKPDFQLAKNNLQYAIAQKHRAAAAGTLSFSAKRP
jgi:tetratricopeptide (TPR) repeat protein